MVKKGVEEEAGLYTQRDNTRGLGSCSGRSLGQSQSWNSILQNVVSTEENWGKGERICLFVCLFIVLCLTTTQKICNDLKNGNGVRLKAVQYLTKVC